NKLRTVVDGHQDGNGGSMPKILRNCLRPEWKHSQAKRIASQEIPRKGQAAKKEDDAQFHRATPDSDARRRACWCRAIPRARSIRICILLRNIEKLLVAVYYTIQ